MNSADSYFIFVFGPPKKGRSLWLCRCLQWYQPHYDRMLTFLFCSQAYPTLAYALKHLEPSRHRNLALLSRFFPSASWTRTWMGGIFLDICYTRNARGPRIRISVSLQRWVYYYAHAIDSKTNSHVQLLPTAQPST